MPEDRTGGGSMLVQLSSTAGQVSSTSFQGLNSAPERRQRFFVELKNVTTVVSWKKLLKSVAPTAVEAPAGANPALEARLAPEVVAGPTTSQKEPLPSQPNRFSSVIEKIERLYKGQDSDDENADTVPDEDQYNTDDSFIDDTELDEYFSVDKAKTKHTGFFINRGKVEKINEGSPSRIIIKKRRPKNVTKTKTECRLESASLSKVASRIKAAARKLPLVATTTAQSDKAELPGQFSLTTSAEAINSVGKSSKETNDNGAILQFSKVKEFNGTPSLKITFKRKEPLKKTSSSLSGFFKDKGPRKEGSKYKPGKKDRCKLASFSHDDLGHKGTLTNDASVPQVMASQRSNAAKLEDANMQIEQLQNGGIPMVTSSKIANLQKPLKGEESKELEGAVSKSFIAVIKSPSPGGKEVSPGKRLSYPKGTVLDRAIQDLQKGVACLCPLTSDNQEMEQLSQSAIKSKRLPRDVKLKLAKVARLAARQGKIPDELVERLMSILGHIMQLKTLKRNLKEMVELGLTAKQEKEGRIVDIKREVTEMVRSRVNSLQVQLEVQQQETSSDDFQLASGLDTGSTSERYKWDHATEDRLCDLYEQYLEGMDEHKGPQIRKLYVELAELWPEGWMDNNGIKNAVYRAKERKKKLNKLVQQEARKRKRIGETSLLEENAEDRHAMPPSSFGDIQATLPNKKKVSPTKAILPCEEVFYKDPLVRAISLNKTAFPIKRKYVRKLPSTIITTPRKEMSIRDSEGKVESSRAAYIDPLRKIRKKISKVSKDGSLSPRRRRDVQSSARKLHRLAEVPSGTLLSKELFEMSGKPFLPKKNHEQLL